MFQNNTSFKIVKLILINCLILVVASSCSKTPSGVRAQVKTQQNTLAPVTTSQATQQAASVNANFTISTISFPNQTDSGYSIDVELQMPSGEILPLTTRHENNNNFSQGVYNDSQRGLQVDIQASCSYDNCSKYLLMVSVYRNSQKLFQTFAISYNNDCKFNVVSSSVNVGHFYSDLNSAERANQNVSPLNDIATCTSP